MKDELDKQGVRWAEDCPKSQAQKAVIRGTQSANLWLYPRGQNWVWSCLTPPLMVCTMGHRAPSAHLQSAEGKHFKKESGKRTAGKQHILLKLPLLEVTAITCYLLCLILNCKHFRAWMTYLVA